MRAIRFITPLVWELTNGLVEFNERNIYLLDQDINR